MPPHSKVRSVTDPLILAAAARDVERAIAASGVDSHRVFELADVDPAKVAEASLRLGLVDYCRLFDLAARETGDDFFGARFGRSFTPADFSIVGRLVVSASTVGEALSALARHYRWIQENTSLQFHVHGDIAVIEYQICDARIAQRQQDAELTIAAFCGLIRHFLGPTWQPLETHFEHGPGGFRRDYRQVFGDTAFDQDTNAILIPSSLLERPMPERDPRQFAACRALISHQLAASDGEAEGRSSRDSRLGLLAHVVENQCKKGDASIGSVAKRIGLTVRGLRRQLRECDVAYDDFLLTVRQTVAARYVESDEYDLTTIALMLGYSDLSAFSRAFRRWHGRSPSAYRRLLDAEVRQES